MAERTFLVATFLPVAVADNANFTDLGYMALQGGSATQRTNINEVQCNGQATVSAVNAMLLARDSTVGATLTALGANESDAAGDPASAALAAPVVPFTASTTKPKRSTTLKLLNAGINAYGGIFRWIAVPGREPSMLGASASFGEVSLSCYAGFTPGAQSGHIKYETL